MREKGFYGRRRVRRQVPCEVVTLQGVEFVLNFGLCLAPPNVLLPFDREPTNEAT